MNGPWPAQPGSHRGEPGAVARLGPRLGAGALVVAALAIGGAVSGLRPDNGVRERPFLQAGRFGHVVSVRTFDVAVLGVRGAATIAQNRQAHDTSGVWLLVRVRLVAVDEATSVMYAALRDQRGRIYRQTMRIRQPLTDGSRELQPGVPVEAEVVFEVPRDAATRLWIRFARFDSEQRMDAMAEVPLLPIERSSLERWLATPEPVQVKAPKVVRL